MKRTIGCLLILTLCLGSCDDTLPAGRGQIVPNPPQSYQPVVTPRPVSPFPTISPFGPTAPPTSPFPPMSPITSPFPSVLKPIIEPSRTPTPR
ncbi:MAG: hypothetical protein ACAI44_31600 [Candidatus Sericytochromatia bacterium]